MGKRERMEGRDDAQQTKLEPLFVTLLCYGIDTIKRLAPWILAPVCARNPAASDLVPIPTPTLSLSLQTLAAEPCDPKPPFDDYSP